MNNHRHTVSREPNVKLNPVSSHGDRFAKRSHRIFRRNGGRTAMTNNQWRIH
jgi:hypothetical protein